MIIVDTTVFKKSWQKKYSGTKVQRYNDTNHEYNAESTQRYPQCLYQP